MRGFLLCFLSLSLVGCHVALGKEGDQRITLPPPESKGQLSVEEAIQRRRSVREFGRGSLALADISQLLWSAQGVTHRDGLRTAPSAGALYPLELYLVAADIEELSAGIYHYRPKKHELLQLASGDVRKKLASAAHGQIWVRRAPALIVITSVYERIMGKYGKRGHRYAHIEVGHVAQNVYLQATALDLGTVIVGAFDDSEVQSVLGLPPDHEPLGIMPVARKR
jgi:SagB-type dehydrogenase family enzyme